MSGVRVSPYSKARVAARNEQVLEAGSEISTTVFIPLDLVYNHYNHTLVLDVDPGGTAFTNLSAPLSTWPGELRARFRLCWPADLALSGQVVLVRAPRLHAEAPAWRFTAVSTPRPASSPLANQFIAFRFH